MHQTLYRKYRPATFEDVSGQEHITSVLRYETETGRTAHAYLFCGSRGTGKTTCAKILAKAVNCEHPVGGDPCGKCDSCRSIDSGNATDVIEMDAASNNGVDYIRDIRDKIVYTPALLKKRVYIIDEVHMLSAGAFNALLKTLEEPPEHAMFILATTELQKLPATIVSRCQRFDFHRISIDDIASRLEYIAGKEGFSLTRRAAELIARQAEGGMRDAISLLELCSSGAAVDENRVTAILGLSSYSQLAEVTKMIAEGDTSGLFATVAELSNSSKDISVFWQELQNFYRDMMVCRYTDKPEQYLDLPKDDLPLLTAASERFSMQTLLAHATLLDSAYQTMLYAPQNKRMTAEFTLIRMCDAQLNTAPEALLARIRELEDKVALLSAGVPVATSKPVENKPEPKAPEAVKAEPFVKKETTAPKVENGSSLSPVRDISEAVDRISRINASMKDFLTDCDVFVSDDGKTVELRTANDFAVMMLSGDQSRKILEDTFAVCKISAPGATVRFVKTNAKADDPLADFMNF